MEYDQDLLRIGGGWFLHLASKANKLSAGRIELAGDLEETVEYNYPLSASGSHTLAVVGTGPQHLHLDSRNSRLADLEVGDGAEVTWSGCLNAARLTRDCAVTSQDLTITGLNLDGHALTITGDVTMDGNLSLARGTLTVKGSVIHPYGTLSLNRGSLTVAGDYRIQRPYTDSSGIPGYQAGTGSLSMVYPEDLLQVEGDMYVQGSNNTLTAGTLSIQGNFTQIAGSFTAGGTHTTVLSGTGDRQIITFSGSSSRFNILELTRKGTCYLFTPDPCWNTLKESSQVTEIPVTNLSISARSKTLTAGQQYQLSAAVVPENATDPTLSWSSSRADVATVDQTGLVTAVTPGSTIIRAETSNGLYRTCTVTVQEVFSGVLEAGSCSALPGEQLLLPVRVCDNPGFAAMKVSISCDAELLTPVDVTAGDLNGDGSVSVKDMVLLAQKLLGISPAEEELAPQGVDPFVLRLGDAVFDSDGYAEVPVTFTGCTGIAGLRLRVDYDPELAELTEIRAASELVEESLCSNLSDPDRRETWITWYDARDQLLNGTMFVLRFRLCDPSFSGIIPVSAVCAEGDACTAALEELSLQTRYGLLHAGAYSSQVQAAGLELISEAGSGILRGTLRCADGVQGTQALLLAAIRQDGRLDAVWHTAVTLEDGMSFTLEGHLPPNAEAELFVLEEASLSPLCPKAQV